MKYKIWKISMLLGLIILSGCSVKEHVDDSLTYHTITAKEAKQMMDKQDVIIVDVRRDDEYAQGHIPNAILVPNETIAQEAEKKLLDKNAVYLIYCRSGNRSAQASQTLAELGYKNVYDFGGIKDWPYEIAGDSNE